MPAFEQSFFKCQYFSVVSSYGRLSITSCVKAFIPLTGWNKMRMRMCIQLCFPIHIMPPIIKYIQWHWRKEVSDSLPFQQRCGLSSCDTSFLADISHSLKGAKNAQRHMYVFLVCRTSFPSVWLSVIAVQSLVRSISLSIY